MILMGIFSGFHELFKTFVSCSRQRGLLHPRDVRGRRRAELVEGGARLVRGEPRRALQRHFPDKPASL